MASATVRLAVQSDFEVVQDLNHQLFVSDSQHSQDLNTNWPYEDEGISYYKKRISGGDGVCFVAEVDGSVVGYVIGGWSHINFSAYKGKRGELENIYVLKDYRKSGVGAALMVELEKWFKENGAEYVMVNAFAKNAGAIAFYEHEGFELYSTTLWKRID